MGDLSFVFQVVSLLCICYFLYQRIRSFYDYFRIRRVVHIPPHFILGNLAPVIFKKMSYPEVIRRSYIQSGDVKYFGVYNLWRPTLYFKDPELIRKVLVEDFDHFSHRGLMFDPERDPLSANMFFASGSLWKEVRSKVARVFTSGKLRGMVPLFIVCATRFEKYLGQSKTIETKTEMTKYSIDVIGSAAFGIDINSYFKDPSEFQRMSRRAFSLEKRQAVSLFLTLFQPRIASLLRLKCVSQDVEDFFIGLVKNTVKSRISSGEKRDDFIQLMINLLENGEFTESLVAAQAFIFLIAGFETSSVTLSFVLYFLAKHESTQNKLRDEVSSVLEKHKSISYEALAAMPYMDAVINETLRLYPPVAGLIRVCTKRYSVPDSEIVLDEGDLIGIPAFAMQRDPVNFTNPEDFIPERWLGQKARRGSFVPFGDGPRICIGLRFATVAMKTVISKLIVKYELSLNAKTPNKLEFLPDSLFYATREGLWVDVKELQ